MCLSVTSFSAHTSRARGLIFDKNNHHIGNSKCTNQIFDIFSRTWVQSYVVNLARTHTPLLFFTLSLERVRYFSPHKKYQSTWFWVGYLPTLSYLKKNYLLRTRVATGTWLRTKIWVVGSIPCPCQQFFNLELEQKIKKAPPARVTLFCCDSFKGDYLE